MKKKFERTRQIFVCVSENEKLLNSLSYETCMKYFLDDYKF